MEKKVNDQLSSYSDAACILFLYSIFIICDTVQQNPIFNEILTIPRLMPDNAASYSIKTEPTLSTGAVKKHICRKYRTHNLLIYVHITPTKGIMHKPTRIDWR